MNIIQLRPEQKYFADFTMYFATLQENLQITEFF